MRERNSKTITFDNAIVTIHFPDLTEDKKRLRTKELQKAAEDLLKSREKVMREQKAG